MMFEKMLSAIKAHDTIILHRHSSPDGDALGSQIGLKHIICENFPEKTVYCVGDAANRYAFMDESAMDEVEDAVYDGALAIVLDASSKNIVSDQRFALAKTTARIDHHIFLGRFTDIEVVDASFESCCGLITQLALECGLRVDAVGAKSLYTGMVTDSGRFRYDCTNARTFTNAAFLMRGGFDLNEIYANLYASDYEQMKLRAKYVLKIRFTPNHAAYIITTLDELKALDADTFSISRGMVSVMSDMRGVDIWVNFTETESGVIAEIRSSKYNINPIAVKYGGGGHAKASGATLKNMEEAMRMLKELDHMAGEGK